MKFIKHIGLILLLTFSLQAREQVNVNFSNLAIDDFVKLVAKITHKNILMNYKINGSVNLVSSAPIYDDELMGMLVSVLQSKGYSLARNGSYYEIVRSSEVARSNADVVKPNQKVSGSLMVTQAVKVEGENVDIIAAKIRYLISKTAKLMTLKESNTILITDYPKNIETIKKIIKDIQITNNSIVKLVYIKHADAGKLQARLLDISKSIFNPKVVSDKVNIIFDENINGLIVIGNKKNVAKIEDLAKKLDVESNISRSVEIYSLKNSDAKNVIKTLKEIISDKTYKGLTTKPNISSSEEINAIIAVADPEILKGIKVIIDALDKEKYQVYVQARIININKNNAESLGMKYGFAAGDVSASGLYAMSANFGDANLQNLASTQIINYLGAIGSGAKSALALGATLDFLQSHGASKTISNPSILCVNNKQSSIYVGKTISIISGATTNAVSGVTNNYKRENIGLTLRIKPRVSSNDKVTLDVEASLENILSSDAAGQPVTSKQEVKTQAILRSGESIIIGGLVKSLDRKTKTKVPLLGDIPMIGEYLFSSTETIKEQDNLVVILTPYVIDKSEELSKLQRDLGVLSSVQKEYNEKIFKKIMSKKNEKIQKNTEPAVHVKGVY
ncbi:secretin N-terminal domain-containing protein [Sulfurimonas hydrogeniphila]|uniref:secretin N-terminal domain-containing protein n=1 Tax=Sulfurimonas hydrogeniphila TaxID=2509341 RepID=UPI00125F9290|nr:secretin N-terminal domain-containing protein [Sulfurimonas hydrogeniphila]